MTEPAVESETTDLNKKLLERDISTMSDREIAEETLYWLRYAGAALAEIQRQGLGGMMKSMFSGNGGRKQ